MAWGGRSKARRGRNAATRTRFGAPFRPLPGALAACLAGGCASVDLEALLAERDAAVARWSSCVDRHAGDAATSLEAVEAARRGCDGYRRDVANTFAPHLEPRVRARLDAQERRRAVRERLERGADPEPLSAAGRLRERLDRLLVRTGADSGDG